MSLRTPESQGGDMPAKRMRLGTKSCVECRRRKVRCIFPPDSQVCEGCALHGVPCNAQQPRPKPRKDAADTVGDNVAMKRRLEELEGMVRRICGALESGESSAIAEVRASTAEALKGIETPSTTASSWGGSHSTSHTEASKSTPDDTFDVSDGSDEPDVFEDAPLIHLFRDAMLIHEDDGRGKGHSTKASTDRRIRDVLQQLAPVVPSSADIDSILEATERYWLIWPACYYGPEPSDSLGPGKKSEAKQFIYDALSSGKPSLMAKATLWLALCVQQVPRNIIQQIKLPTAQERLVNLYLSHAKTLLDVDEDAGGTTDGLVCMQMKYKLYINMGKPRKAWYWMRQGVSAAVGLGLHRLDKSSDPRQKALWSATWGPERHLSLFLGLPSSISSLHPGISEDLVGPSPMEKIFFRIASIAGSVIDRDQNYKAAGYATTVQINQEMEETRALFPDDWWQPPPADFTLADHYHRQSCKFMYFILLKLVHLPYMLKSIREKKYSHSWDVAMEASRCAAQAYRDFRNAPMADANLCQLMDFQAVSAAIVLVVGHLTSPARTDDAVKEADWNLVWDISLSLRRTALVLHCRVAEQSAHILDLLSAARHGAYVGPEDYTVTIPYFGRVRINREVAAGGRNNNGSAALEMNSQQQQMGEWSDVSSSVQMPFANSIEFSTSEFGQDLPMKFHFESELSGDWTDPSIFDVQYDWRQTFTSDPFY